MNTLLKRELTRDFYIPSNATTVSPEGVNAVAYYYDLDSSTPAAIIFIGKSKKPSKHLCFRTEERREEWTQDIFENVKANTEAKEARAAKDKAAKAEAADTVQVGDVFSSSWGYDQTNVDFYKCVAKRGQMLDVIKVGSLVDHSDQGSDYLLPDVACEIGEVMTKRVNQHGGFKVESFANAYPFDGKPEYQTAWGYGH